ncbi:uncharacterized protein LOC141902825 [Tubulanus polymorphus]|uniref:uncharacterized protein LOC141902825 n=1 Tax=Tubulanus polymorphus TaxID=672921 RepID=UPI003DA253FE
MLRRIAFNNVIQFVEPHVLSFTPSDPPLLEVDGQRYPQCNLGIFVGENGSGKSSIFELIVSCAAPPTTVIETGETGGKSDSRARSATIIPNTPSNGKSGYTFCEFEIPTSMGAKMNLPNSARRTSTGNYLVILGLEVPGQTREKIRRIIIPVDSSKDEICSRRRGVFVMLLTSEKCEQLFKTESDVIGILSKSDVAKRNDVANVDWLDIGNVYEQITDSIIVGHRYSQEDFDLYINKAKEHPEFVARVHDVFFKIIGNTDYQFVIEDGQLFCREMNDAACESKTETWQAPSGILDAFLMAFYLSLDDKLTLLLEEPIKSMHPLLVRALRDIFLLGVTGKTVIAVCHSERLISAYTVAFMFRFRRVRIQDGDRILRASKIYELKNLAVTNHGGHPFAYLTVERIRDVLFANRILFVEGRDDRRFVHATLDLIERKYPGILRMCGEDVEQLIGPLTQISVIQMDGKMHMDSCVYVAENSGLKKRYALLLDRDVLTGNEVFVSSFVQTLKKLLEFYDDEKQTKLSQIICRHCLCKYDSANQDRKHFFGIIREILKAVSDRNYDSLRGVVEKKLMSKIGHIFQSSEDHASHVTRQCNNVTNAMQNVEEMKRILDEVRREITLLVEKESPTVDDLLDVLLRAVPGEVSIEESLADSVGLPNWDDCKKLSNELLAIGTRDRTDSDPDISFILYRVICRKNYLPKMFLKAKSFDKLRSVLLSFIVTSSGGSEPRCNLADAAAFVQNLSRLDLLCQRCILLEKSLATLNDFEKLFDTYALSFAVKPTNCALESRETDLMQFVATAYKLCFRKSVTLSDLEAEILIRKQQIEERRFIWIDGDLEDMVNSTKQETRALPLIKRKWSSLRRGDLWALVKELVENDNKDFRRFVQFLVSFVKEEIL